MEELSEKHIAFCEEYLKCWNGTKAYMAIYPGSSYDAARSSAADLLANPNIKAYVQSRSGMTADEVVELLAKRARDEGDKQVQVRALGLMGKVHGLFIDRSEVSLKAEVSWKDFVQQDGQNDAGDHDKSS